MEPLTPPTRSRRRLVVTASFERPWNVHGEASVRAWAERVGAELRVCAAGPDTGPGAGRWELLADAVEAVAPEEVVWVDEAIVIRADTGWPEYEQWAAFEVTGGRRFEHDAVQRRGALQAGRIADTPWSEREGYFNAGILFRRAPSAAEFRQLAALAARVERGLLPDQAALAVRLGRERGVTRLPVEWNVRGPTAPDGYLEGYVNHFLGGRWEAMNRLGPLWTHGVRALDLSVVAVGRNDDYGGDFIHRMSCFARHLCEQWARIDGRFELIIVDWNPLDDRPGLARHLSFLRPPENVRIRLVHVPKEIHQRFDNAEHMPLFEYIGKNTGIRRARGEFILATNPDILFSEALLSYMSRVSGLARNGFYRADRHDFGGRIDLAAPLEENLATAAGSVESKFLFLPHLAVRDSVNVDGPPYLAASGDFLLAHRTVWQRLKGYRQWPTSSHIDSVFVLEAVRDGFTQHVVPSHMHTLHQVHSVEERHRRPGTNLNRWESLCREEDERCDRNDWGLGELMLDETLIASGV